MKSIIQTTCFLIIGTFLFGNNNPKAENATVIAFSGLTIRATPSLQGKPLEIVPFGERVEVIETSDNQQVIEWTKGQWIKVKYGTIEGYVFDGFLTKLPLPTYDFELSQNDLDLTYPVLAWAENNFDYIAEPDTIEKNTSIKVIQYLENNLILKREESDDQFVVTLTLPNQRVSDAYNLLRSMLLTKTERHIFEKNSNFIADEHGDIYRIKIALDKPVNIRQMSDGDVKITVTSFHEDCAF